MHRVHLYDLDITDVKLFDCAALCTCSTCLGWVRSGFAVKKLGLVGLGRRDSGLAPANWTHVNLRFVYGTGQGCAENRKHNVCAGDLIRFFPHLSSTQSV